MIAGRPEFSRSVPRGSMLLIDTVPEKIVRAGLVRSMMETDEPLRRFFFGLIGARHDERPNFHRSGRPSSEALNCNTLYLIQQWPNRRGRNAGRVSRRNSYRLHNAASPFRAKMLLAFRRTTVRTLSIPFRRLIVRKFRLVALTIALLFAAGTASAQDNQKDGPPDPRQGRSRPSDVQ